MKLEHLLDRLEKEIKAPNRSRAERRELRWLKRVWTGTWRVQSEPLDAFLTKGISAQERQASVALR